MEAIDILSVRQQVEEVMKDVPSSHGFAQDGFGHVQIGTEYAGLLSMQEGVNLNLGRVTFLVHDIRWWDGPERRARKIQINSTGLEDKVSGRNILKKLVNSGRMSEDDFSQALEAAEKHSLLPSQDPQPTALSQVIRDADRLTRMGMGVLSILEGNNFYGNVPFYVEGDEIVRAVDAPMIPFGAINSCITDINSCTGDWVKIMETQSGKTLALALSRVNEEFLKTFQAHTELNEYRIWIDWLNGINASMAQERLNLRVQLEEGQITPDQYVKALLDLEKPELVDSEGFKLFLSRNV